MLAKPGVHAIFIKNRCNARGIDVVTLQLPRKGFCKLALQVME